MGPNSYDLHLHNELEIHRSDVILDAKKPNLTEKAIIPENGYLLEPGNLYLGRTVEYTESLDFVPMLEGRSSMGRLGLFIHATAGFGDLGFKGYWTLELSVVVPLIIYPNMRVCQIYYHDVHGDKNIVYDGKYQRNCGIQASKSYEDMGS